MSRLSQENPMAHGVDEIGEYPVYSPQTVARSLNIFVPLPIALYWEPNMKGQGIGGWDFDLKIPKYYCN